MAKILKAIKNPIWTKGGKPVWGTKGG